MKCIRKNCQNEAQIHRTYGVLPCAECQLKDSIAGQSGVHGRILYDSVGQLDRIQRQRDSHSKDLLQPFVGNRVNKDFFQAYPNQVKEYGVRKELEKL